MSSCPADGISAITSLGTASLTSHSRSVKTFLHVLTCTQLHAPLLICSICQQCNFTLLYVILKICSSPLKSPEPYFPPPTFTHNHQLTWGFPAPSIEHVLSQSVSTTTWMSSISPVTVLGALSTLLQWIFTNLLRNCTVIHHLNHLKISSAFLIMVVCIFCLFFLVHSC